MYKFRQNLNPPVFHNIFTHRTKTKYAQYELNEPRSGSGDKVLKIFFQFPVSVVQSYFILYFIFNSIFVNFKYFVIFVGICSVIVIDYIVA